MEHHIKPTEAAVNVDDIEPVKVRLTRYLQNEAAKISLRELRDRCKREYLMKNSKAKDL